MYLEEGSLNVVTLGRGYAWLDTGTVDSLAEATEFVRVIETRTDAKIAALEEIAYRNGWIDRTMLLALCGEVRKVSLRAHLRAVATTKFAIERHKDQWNLIKNKAGRRDDREAKGVRRPSRFFHGELFQAEV